MIFQVANGFRIYLLKVHIERVVRGLRVCRSYWIIIVFLKSYEIQPLVIHPEGRDTVYFWSSVTVHILSPFSLNATFRVVFLIITTTLTQICMMLKVVVYLSERKDNDTGVK